MNLKESILSSYYYPDDRETAVIQAINALIDNPSLYSEAKDPWGKVYADNVAAKIRQNAGQADPVRTQKNSSLLTTKTDV